MRLDINTCVIKGIIFINLEGELNKESFIELEDNLNYLLYRQRMHYFIIDFKNVKNIDNLVFSLIQNKIVEIFLSCGKVVLCGLNNLKINKYLCRENIVVNDCFEAINKFYI